MSMRLDTGLALVVMALWGLWSYAEGRATVYAKTFGYAYVYTIVMLVGATLEFPAYRWFYRHLEEPNPVNRGAFLWAGIAFTSSLAASLVYLAALRNGRFAVVTSIAGAYPVVGVLLTVVSGQKISRQNWMGIVLITAGCWLLNRSEGGH